MAHASAWPDWLRPGTAQGRTDRGYPAGDVVWFSPGEKHWHGAAPATAMTHIAFRKKRTARWSNGWNKSATSNTAPINERTFT